MVRYGFSLSEVRGLYIDELMSYFTELVKILESEGVLKAGTTDKVENKSEVDLLRKQLGGLFIKPKKK